jgi:hypothetical protein
MIKRFLPIVVLLVALSAGAAVALSATGSAADERPISSIDDIDPDECNLVHNIDACEEGGGQPPIRSDEGIDPNECNFVHNIDSCSAEQLEDAGIMPVPPDADAPVPSGDDIDPDACSLVHNVDACE